MKNLGIFGSYARGDNTVESDIDLMVDFDRPIGLEFAELAVELENLLGKKVDLVSKEGIKPQYLEYVNKDLIYV